MRLSQTKNKQKKREKHPKNQPHLQLFVHFHLYYWPIWNLFLPKEIRTQIFFPKQLRYNLLNNLSSSYWFHNPSLPYWSSICIWVNFWALLCLITELETRYLAWKLSILLRILDTLDGTETINFLKIWNSLTVDPAHPYFMGGLGEQGALDIYQFPKSIPVVYPPVSRLHTCSIEKNSFQALSCTPSLLNTIFFYNVSSFLHLILLLVFSLISLG
jgi:hypothetical protein